MIMSVPKWVILTCVMLGYQVQASEDFILLQSTTSTQNSGLYEYLLPNFEKTHEIKVKVVAVGTGQALYNGSRCNGDVVIVHSPEDEKIFVESGYGINPHDLMYNRFVFVGPRSDPVGLKEEHSLQGVINKLGQGLAPFISRGDDSGTHKKELSLWRNENVWSRGDWYLEVGSGMGAALNIAIGLDGYTLTDLGTWLSFSNKSNHEILYSGGAELFNQYGIILVDPEHCPNANIEKANQFLQWMISPEGQQLIARYKINGQQLFFPNAKPKKFNE